MPPSSPPSERRCEIQERAIPVPGPRQVQVKIEASGICHTDIHAAHGDWPVQPTAPFVPGHEGVGVVTAIGDQVTEHAVGDRVALPWLGTACGNCRYCVSGWETLCLEQQNTGYSIDGGYAEYAVADARFAVTVPDGVTSFDAAPLTCAGVTTYKAVKVSGARSGDLVSVVGIGGLGHLAVQYAAIAGATVVAVDVSQEKLDLAKQLGRDVHRRREQRGPGGGDPGARRRRRRDRAGRAARVDRQGVRLAAPRRPAGAGLAAEGGRAQAPRLRDRAQGHQRHRLDRRHPPGPGRGLRPPRRRAAPGSSPRSAGSRTSTSPSTRCCPAGRRRVW